MFRRFFHRPQNLWLRRAVFQVHLWTGVIFGLYFLVISLSGSALVFERELMNDAPALKPPPAAAKRATYGQLVETGRTGISPYELESIDMRTRDRRLVTMTFQKGNRHRVLYLDLYTGRAVGQLNLEEKHPVMLFLEQLHNELLGGRRGAVANGVGGALLSLMCITGIILWWPGQRVWRRALTVNWRAKWRRINFDLHSSVGFWVLPLVAMWAVTGVYFIFPDIVQKSLRLFQTPASAKQSTWLPGAKLQPIDTYLDKAAKEFPRDKLAYLYMDVFRPGGQVSAFLSRDPAVPLTLEEDIVRFDPATAEVLLTESSDRWSLMEKIFMSFYSVHFGDFAGTLSKTLWAVLGLALSLLTITGYLMWWNRLLRKKWEIYAGSKRSSRRIPQHSSPPV